MFREIDADAYILVDGDDTYPAEEVHVLLDPVLNEGIDMAIGDRLSNGTYYSENKRAFHEFGNNMVRNLINHLFHGNIHDIMTGYRAFSRRFVKCMPIQSDGFQIETEMSVFALISRMKIREVPITYRDRPEGSFSKLNTYKDGMRVLLTLFDLYKNYRPMFFFFWFFLFFLVLGILVSTIGSPLAGSALMVISAVIMMSGIILDAIKNQALQNLNEVILAYKEREDKHS